MDLELYSWFNFWFNNLAKKLGPVSSSLCFLSSKMEKITFKVFEVISQAVLWFWFLSLPKLTLKISHVAVVRGRAFRRWLGSESSALLYGSIYSWVNGLSCEWDLWLCKKKRPEQRCSTPLSCDALHLLGALQRVPNSKKALTRWSHSTLNFSMSITLRNKFLFLFKWIIQFQVFCYKQQKTD